MNKALGGGQRELLVKFKVLKFLGKGSYGSVFQVQRLGDGQMYALKEMDVRSMSQAEREDSVNEVRLLASVAHPNVIGYNEAFLDGNRLCIIMEYAPDGDLSKVIKKWQMMRRPIPEDLIWKYFIQVARGLSALHNMKILHRDIKPGNIMITPGDVAKIGDLGIAKLLKHTMAAKTQIGTPHYMPPEIWKNRPYAFSSDTWALGCILYEMATFSVPFEARSMNELRYKVLRGTYPPLPSTYSRDLAQMVKDCLDPLPEKRPTIDTILASQAVASRGHLVPTGEAARPPRPPSVAGSNVLDTIKVPRGNFHAIKGKLPPANYANDPPSILGGIQEDDEQPAPRGARAEVMDVHRLPNIPGRQQQPSPQRMPAPNIPPQLQPNKLPQVAQGLPPRPYGGMPPQGMLPAGALPGRAPPQRPPAIIPPSQPQQGGPDSRMWQPPKPMGVAATPQSESHSAYGAFYKQSPTSAAAAAIRPKVYEDPRFQQQRAAAAAAAAQQAYQANKPGLAAYYNPYADRRQGGGYPGGGAGLKLPPVLAAQQAAAGAGAGKAGAASRPPPPWNYGAVGNARAAALAYAAQLRNLAAGGAGGGGGGGDAGAGIARYPPPQWVPSRVR